MKSAGKLFAALNMVCWASAGWTEIEEITVVAEKREANLQNVPISMAVLGRHAINQQNISDGDDIYRVAPNLSLKQKSAIKSGFAVRGIGTDSFHMSVQESVGTYLDEVALVSPFVSQLGLWDIAQIELLRGPQNSLYGRNTLGGAVNYLTRKASIDDGANGHIKASGGSAGHAEIEAALGFNLGEYVAIRVSAVDQDFAGHWRNLATGDDLGGLDRDGYRLAAHWQPRAELDIQGIYFHAAKTTDSLPQSWLGNLNADGSGDCPVFAAGEASLPGPNGCTTRISRAQLQGSDILQTALASGNRQLITPDPMIADTYLVNYSAKWGDTWQAPGANRADSELDMGYLRVTAELSALQLTSISSYQEFSVAARFSSDLHSFATGQFGDWQVKQQEFRLMSAPDDKPSSQWLLGLYWSEQDSKQDTIVLRTDRAIAPGVLIDSEYRNLSVFGQLDLPIGEQWQMTIGGRYTRDNLEADRFEKWACNMGSLGGLNRNSPDEMAILNRDYLTNNCANVSFGPLPPLRFTAANPTELLDLQQQDLAELGVNVRVSWQGNSDNLWFFTTSRSFKGGAYDNRALGDGSSPIDPEYLTAFEVGYKDLWAEGQFRSSAAIFYYRWRDQQLFEVIGGSPATLNIKSTALIGAELSLDWIPSDSWSTSLGLGWLDSKIRDLANDHPATSQAQIGNEVTYTPDLTANLQTTYFVPVGPGELRLSAAARYVGEQYLLINNSPRSQLDSQAYLDVFVSYVFGSDRRYTISLSAENLTETRTYNRIAAGPGELAWNTNQPGFTDFRFSVHVAW
ncbi:MAG: TonB-dependent receptor [Pseudomonadales bacterium]